MTGGLRMPTFVSLTGGAGMTNMTSGSATAIAKIEGGKSFV